MSNKIKTKLVLAVHLCLLRKSESTTLSVLLYTVKEANLKDGHRLLLDTV